MPGRAVDTPIVPPSRLTLPRPVWTARERSSTSLWPTVVVSAHHAGSEPPATGIGIVIVPTTRGFASILHGEPVRTLLDVLDDFYVRMGLREAVSLLRPRGMIKRNVREHVNSAARTGP